jgi:hypothetical protein
VVVVRGDVAGLVAAHAVRSALPEVPTGAVVRRGAVPAVGVAELIGCSLLGELPPLAAAHRPLDPRRLPRPSTRAAARVLAALEAVVGHPSATVRAASS